ncbi:MAG: helix-turn-helix domain-containing protein [Roseiarcus sp.]|jgi:AcrR family transcriptional regulator
MAARSSRQDLDFIRTTPKQARSEATVEAIFEASARILQRQGAAAFNTNAVAAALAGVSVGTLYQYFANKDTILIAMARKELGKTLADAVSRLQPKGDALSRLRGLGQNRGPDVCRINSLG